MVPPQLPRQHDHHRTHHYLGTIPHSNTTTASLLLHQCHGLRTPQPYRACPPRPTTVTGACASTDRRRTKAVRDPPRAIDTASSAITQRPRAIDLKLGPPAAGQRRRPRPHQTLPDLTSAGQGFDRSAIVPVYYACTTSFTSPPTAALPSVRDGADPWRAGRSTLSAIATLFGLCACLILLLLLLLLLPPRVRACARTTWAASLSISQPPH